MDGRAGAGHDGPGMGTTRGGRQASPPGTSSSGESIPPWVRTHLGQHIFGAPRPGGGGDSVHRATTPPQGGLQPAHWSTMAKKGKGVGAKGEAAAQENRRHALPAGPPMAPSLDQLRVAMREAEGALGPSHTVTRVVRAEYEAAVHLRFCKTEPAVTQLEKTRVALHMDCKQLRLVQAAMAQTAEDLQQKLLVRSRQISEEMELREKIRWQRSEVEALSHMIEAERRRSRPVRAAASSSDDGGFAEALGRTEESARNAGGQRVLGRSRPPNRPQEGKGQYGTQRMTPVFASRF